jgi:hypothetical protein
LQEGFTLVRNIGAVPVLLWLLLAFAASGGAAATTAYFKVGDDLKASCEGTAAGEPNASTAEYLLCLGYLQAVVDSDAPRLSALQRGQPRADRFLRELAL